MIELFNRLTVTAFEEGFELSMKHNLLRPGNLCFETTNLPICLNFFEESEVLKPLGQGPFRGFYLMLKYRNF
jgi:hypothetical protein